MLSCAAADPAKPSFKDHRTRIWFYRDGTLEEYVTLPSAGDTAYPGLVPSGDRGLLVSYYSQHETVRDEDYAHEQFTSALKEPVAANIYLAKINIL